MSPSASAANMATCRSRTPSRRTQAIQAHLMKQRGEVGGALLKFDAILPTPRRKQSRLGVRLRRVSDGKLEVVTAGDENDAVRPGCIAEWNKLHANRSQTKLRIIPGDRITAVNHSLDYISMLEELDQASHMTLSIERDEPGVLTPMPDRFEQKTQPVKKLKEEDLARQRLEASRKRQLLPPLPHIKTGSRKPSITSIGEGSMSEGSTREPTPRKDAPESPWTPCSDC